MPKPTSTNSQNRRRIVHECPMTYTFTLLGNRWKPIILWKISEGEDSSASLQRAIPIISRKMLFQDLRPGTRADREKYRRRHHSQTHL